MIVTLPSNSATRASRMIRRSHLSRKKNNFTLAFWENQVFLYYLANCGNFGEKIWRFIKPKARYSNSVRIKTKHENFSSILNLQKENRWLQREFELFCQVFYSKVVWPDTKPLFVFYETLQGYLYRQKIIAEKSASYFWQVNTI